MKPIYATIFTTLTFVVTQFLPVHAQVRQDKQLSYRVVAYSPEEQLKHFKLPDGYTIELVASEQDGIIKPIDIAFDDGGNLWTQSAVMYPLDPVSDIQWNDLLELMDDVNKQRQHPVFQRIANLYKGNLKGEDKIFKISGLYDGRKIVRTWAEGLAIPMSVLPYKDGAIVAQGSEVFLLRDTNKDGIADTRKPLLTGFGFTDTHTMAHLLRKGPGGWIYFSHGALNKGEVTAYDHPNVRVRFDYSKTGRFQTDGSELEVVTAGLNNIWGYTQRASGQWFGSEANDLGYSVVPMEPGTAYPGIGSERFRKYQPFYPEIHSFRVGGTGLSGLAFSDDELGGFPDALEGVAILANPITNSINRVRIVQQPDGSIVSEKLEDLLVSDDDWFRPVNVTFGPDGALYIADWYNKIVSHNEVPTTHPDRDKQHGRIWRIKHRNQKTRAIVDFYKVPTAQLPNYLKSLYVWERKAAWSQIAERDPSETKKLIPELVKIVNDQSLTASKRIHGLWALESLSYFKAADFSRWLTDSEADVRRETLRYLERHPSEIEQFNDSFQSLLTDPYATVRSQAIRTLSKVANPSVSTIGLLVNAYKEASSSNKVGGAYEANFEGYLVRKAMEQYPDALIKFLEQPNLMNHYKRELLIGVLQVLEPQKRAKYYFQLVEKDAELPSSDAEFLRMAAMVSDQRAYRKVETASLESNKQLHYAKLMLANREDLQDKALIPLLTKLANKLLSEREEQANKVAFDLITSFQLAVPVEQVLQYYAPDENQDFQLAILRVLDSMKEQISGPYKTVAQLKNWAISARLQGLQGWLRTDFKTAQNYLIQLLNGMDVIEKQQVTNQLSRYKHSVPALLSLVKQKHLLPLNFEILTAERMLTQSDGSMKEEAAELVNAVRVREIERQKGVTNRIEQIVKKTALIEGDAMEGKVLFQTCLLCHQVRGEGNKIAPSLDGLAYRDTGGLLHAVLDPDAAIENGYAVFRIVKKDDSILEGFLLRREQTGTTLAFMGGNEVFVPAAEIKSQHTVMGKSFMPGGLIDQMTDKEVASLLAYIKTIQ